MKKFYLLLIAIFCIISMIPFNIYAIDETIEPTSLVTPTPTSRIDTFVIGYIDYGVVSVSYNNATIAIGYETERREVPYDAPIGDYLLFLKYWEEGSDEEVYLPRLLLTSFPEREEKTITGLKPSTKYYYQFFDEPVNSFTTLSDSGILVENEDYEINFDVNNYDTASTVNITIKNISDKDITDWKLSWDFDNSSQILYGWSAKYIQIGKNIVATPEVWNSIIPSGSSINIGFNTNGIINQFANLVLESTSNNNTF